jgi:RNA polymerase sigma-70 factor, ECF subfamily
VLRLETNRYVADLLATLPQQQAEVLRLRIAAGLSAEETAAVLSMSAGAVRVAQHRALSKLREQLRAGQVTS